MTQNITSAKTSQNIIAGGFKKAQFKKNSVNLDFGGGKYDTASKWLLEEKGVTNYVYDPYNRTYGHNLEALNCNPDTITCFNVLNVIQDKEVFNNIIEHMCKYEVSIFITTYEGKRDGIGKKTSKGYQRNAKTDDYVNMINDIVPSDRLVLRNGKIILIVKRDNKTKINFN